VETQFPMRPMFWYRHYFKKTPRLQGFLIENFFIIFVDEGRQTRYIAHRKPEQKNHYKKKMAEALTTMPEATPEKSKEYGKQ